MVVWISIQYCGLASSVNNLDTKIVKFSLLLLILLSQLGHVIVIKVKMEEEKHIRSLVNIQVVECHSNIHVLLCVSNTHS